MRRGAPCKLSSPKWSSNEQVSVDLCFFTKGESPMRNLFRQDKLSIQFFYKYLLESFIKRVICVRPNIADLWMLHYYNALCHTAHFITEFLATKAFLWLPSPPIHLTSAPITFSFFLNWNMSSKDVTSRLWKTFKRA